MASRSKDGLSLPAGLVAIPALLIGLLCGCGSATPGPGGGSSAGEGGQSTTPVAGESTAVTVLFSSSANDELTDFQLNPGRLTLNDANGKSVTVFNLENGNQLAEFMHSNSILDPVMTVSVPQDVYTSATLTYSSPQFTFVTYNGGYIYFNTDISMGGSGFAPAQVSLPAAITVSGNSMALIVSSQVSQSVSMSGSPQQNNFSSSVAPRFAITAAALDPDEQDTAGSAEVNAFRQITSLQSSASGEDSLVLTSPSGSALTVTSNSTTTYQGIGGFDSLSAGMFADVDIALQPDGTLLATRVEVPDTAARDLVTGPVFNIDPSDGIFNLVGEREEGQDFSSGFRSGGMALQFTGDTQFRIDGGFQAPQGLPFTPGFDGTSIVVGQNVAVTSQAIPLSGPYPTVTTVTLLPQTVDGTIDSVTSSNGLQVYEVSLAPYDPLSAARGSASLQVYVSSATRMLNTAPVQAGEVLRLHGMVFSAGGSLQMVADQVNDGVAE